MSPAAGIDKLEKKLRAEPSSKVFLPLGAIFFTVGLGKFAYDLTTGNFSETALMGFLGGTLIWGVGLLADQIAKLGLRGERL